MVGSGRKRSTAMARNNRVAGIGGGLEGTPARSRLIYVTSWLFRVQTGRQL
jgi:hypothetical protein